MSAKTMFIKSKILTIGLILSGAIGLTSCVEQYTIAGNTSLPMLDGRRLYLKTSTLHGEHKIDSCEVIHGQFSFDGKVDSTVVAELFVDNMSLMPIVVENGKIKVDINVLDQKASGSTLNERLYKFLDDKARLDGEIENTSNNEIELLMRGVHPFEAEKLCRDRAARLSRSSDSLIVSFIRSNYNNVLGPEIFKQICMQYRYPIITPQIHQIVDGAPDKFLRNPYIREYLSIARRNTAILCGEQKDECEGYRKEGHSHTLKVKQKR